MASAVLVTVSSTLVAALPHRPARCPRQEL